MVKSICDFLCICFEIKKEIKESKRIYEQINEILNKRKKEEKLVLSEIKKKNENKRFFNPKTEKFRGIIIEDSKEINISIRFLQRKKFKITEDNIEKLDYKSIKEIFSLLTTDKIESIGKICASFRYDNSKYKSAIVDLPISIPVGELSQTKLGETTITGLHLKFKDSKIGIERLMIAEYDKDLVTYIVYGYKTKNYINILKNNYKQAIKISELFIKGE